MKKRETLSGGCGYRAALAPYSIWAMIFVLVPLIFVAYYAFTDNDFNFTTANIAKFFNSTSSLRKGDGTTKEVHTYIVIALRSLKLALISTIVCLLIGYPFAYIMSRAKERTQKTMMTLVMIPMWMNFLIRTYAWMTIMQDTGILNNLLAAIGLHRIKIIGTETAVVIGMVYDFLPYMVLPIYSIMAKMDDKLLEAAKDLGCNNLSTLRRVVLPLSMPGVVSGITMVLIPAISTFYISQKLGSGKFLLIGDVIEGQYVANNFHFAAAIALVLMVVLLLAMTLFKYLTARRTYGGK